MKKNVNKATQAKGKQAVKNPAAFNNRNKTLWLLAVIIITIIAFSPVFKLGFVNWDDKEYILENPFIKQFSFQNIKLFFTEFFLGNYHPFAMLTFALDYKMGGINPFIYHFTNLLFHVCTTLFIFKLAKQLFERLDVAILIAALFGVHAMHVESIAWVAERKDVMYAFFYVTSLLSYVIYIKKTSSKYLYFSLALFICALLSKGQAVSLSVTLILIDIFFNRNLLSKKVIFEKIPFLILSVIFGLIAIRAQQGAVITLPLHERFFYASFGYVQYLLKLIYPFKLSAYYPYPFGGITGSNLIEFSVYILITIGIIISLVYSYRKGYKNLFFGLAFYTVNIFLVLQLLPVGNAIMADRYSYIPSIGFFIIIGTLYSKLSEFTKYKYILVICTFAYVFLLVILTYQRCAVWDSGLTLWGDAVEKYPDSHIAIMQRGCARNDIKDFKGGIEDFNKAISIYPEYSYAFSYRGSAKANLGDLKGALEDYNQSIKLLPDKYGYYSGRGIVRAQLGDTKGAIEDFNKALELNYLASDVYSNRGIAKAISGDNTGALQDFEKSLSLNPDFIGAYINRGRVKIALGKKEDGCNDFYYAKKLGTSEADKLILQNCK